MKSKRLMLLWLLGGWLVFSQAFAQTPSYLVIGAQPYELQDMLNAKLKEGWMLKSIITWSTKCPNDNKECLLVVLERK